MRKGLAALAVCGILAAAWHVGQAEERSPDEGRSLFSADAGQGRFVSKSDSTDGRSATSTPRLKNYHRALFGDSHSQMSGAPAQPAVRTTPRSTFLNGSGSGRTSTAPVVSETMKPADQPVPEAKQAFDPSVVAEPVVAAPPQDIRQASHQKSQSLPESEPITRISGEEGTSSPFRTIADVLGSPTRRPVRTAEMQSGRPRADVRVQPVVERKPARPLSDEAPQNRRTVFTPSATGSASGQQTPTVTIEWIKRSHINVGQECRCDLVVRNNGRIPVRDIAVDAYFPESVRLTAATPQPVDSTDRLTWAFDELKAGGEAVIEITLVPSVPGELSTNALVRFTGQAIGAFDVVEPKLQLNVKGPQKVMVGDPASQIVTISNPGTGIAENVYIEAIVPKGLEHPRGERLSMPIGTINPGESRVVRLSLAAMEGGQHQVTVAAMADHGLSQTVSSDVLVVAPSLSLKLDGPDLRYVGRSAQYVLSVSNKGQAASNNVRVKHQVPDGFEYVDSTGGGLYDQRTRMVSWFVGRLEPGESAQVHLELMPKTLGDYVHRAGALSEQGVVSEAQLPTRVDGSSSLALEIVDLDDPVEVGVETVYEIRLRNDGSKAAGNVGVSCELPAGVELITAKGPTSHIAENQIVVFKSLDSLQAGETAVYRVFVRGRVEGNHRFRARLASDSVKEPLISEELTKFYGG